LRRSSFLPFGALTACNQTVSFLSNKLIAVLFLADDQFRLLLFQLKLPAHGGDAIFQRLPFAVPLSLLAFDLFLTENSGGFFMSHLKLPSRSREDTPWSHVHILQLEPPISQQKFSDLVGVGHAARLKNVYGSITLAAQLNVPQ